jgi:hypothetical protein
MVPHSLEVPEPINLMARIGHYARESSAWYTRIFAIVLIVALSWHYGAGYWYGGTGTPPTVDYLIDKAFILVGFASLLGGSIGREFYVSRKERYANIFDRVDAVTATLRDLTTYLDEISIHDEANKEQIRIDVRNELSSALDNIGELFSMVTGTTCRVAIKCCFFENDDVYVYTITRDGRSNKLNYKKDRQRFESRSDSIGDNEDFFSIFYNDTRYYIENNLANKRNYANSSFAQYGEPPERIGLFGGILNASIRWPLPYKSTMVFAIEQLAAENLSFEELGCIGFLAIDSAFGNVFKPRFDGPLGASLANAFFSPLIRYVSLLGEANEVVPAHGA